MNRSGFNRRHALGVIAGSALVAMGTSPSSAAIDPSLALIVELTGASPLREGRIRLTIPQLADTGHSVPVTIDVESPMTAGDFVKIIYLIAPLNPRPLAASFFLGPLAARASITTRMRLATGQDVVAIAMLSDGTHCLARAKVVVTVSSCIDGT